jgi:integrase
MAAALKQHLSQNVGPEPHAWLFPDGQEPNGVMSLERAWRKARTTIGRPDLHLHDRRHSGLTWSAATGATTAELMHRAGHASAVAALRYQHATADRDRAIADALAGLGTAKVAPINRRKRRASGT